MTGSRNTGYRRAQRTIPIFEDDKCDHCGGTTILQRHHKDGNAYNNNLTNVEILCQKCHVAEHMRMGTWGKGKTLTPKECVVCGTPFQPRKDRDKLCGHPSCLEELGRRSAIKRWFHILAEESRTE